MNFFRFFVSFEIVSVFPKNKHSFLWLKLQTIKPIHVYVVCVCVYSVYIHIYIICVGLCSVYAENLSVFQIYQKNTELITYWCSSKVGVTLLLLSEMDKNKEYN